MFVLSRTRPSCLSTQVLTWLQQGMSSLLAVGAHISVVVRPLGRGQSHNGTYRQLITAFDEAQAAAAWETMRGWWHWEGRRKVSYPVRVWALSREELGHILVKAHPERQPPPRTQPDAGAAASSSHLPRPPT